MKTLLLLAFFSATTVSAQSDSIQVVHSFITLDNYLLADVHLPLYYFPFYNGIQVVEFGYYERSIQRGMREDMIHPRGGSSYWDAVNFHIPNGYIVRDTNGIIIANYGVNENDFSYLQSDCTKYLQSHANRYNEKVTSELRYTGYHEVPKDAYIFRSTGKVGVIDTFGVIRIPLEYDDICFTKAHYFVQKNRMNGTYSSDFIPKIPTKYGRLELINEDLFIVNDNGCYFVDRFGDRKDNKTYNELTQIEQSPLIRFQINGKYGLIDQKLHVVTNELYNMIEPIDSGYFFAYDSIYNGAILNRDGLRITPFLYKNRKPRILGDGYFLVMGPPTNLKEGQILGYHYGVVDTLGTVIFQTNYNSIEYFGNDIFYVKTLNKVGLITRNGKELVPLKYDRIYRFYENLAIIEKEGLYGVIDTSGRFMLPLQFKQIACLTERTAVVRDPSSKLGLINLNTGLKSAFIYDNFACCKYGLVRALRDGKWGYLNDQGIEITPFQFDAAFDFVKWGYALFEQNGKYGVIDRKGKIVAEPIYKKFTYSEDFRIELEKGSERIIFPSK